MQLSSLSAKQKRILDWSKFIEEGGVQDPTLKRDTKAKLEALKGVIASCWKAQSISPGDEQKILDLERSLEHLNEEARLRVGSNTPLKKVSGASE